MKKTLILLLILIIGISFPVLAQKKTPLGKSDPRAKKILDRTSKEYASFNSLKADFTMKVENIHSENSPNKDKEGTIWIKGDNFKFKLGAITVFSNGKTLWTYNKGINEVQITDYEPEEGQITPNTLFKDFYDKDFLYRLKDETTLNDQKVNVIDMTPMDKSKPYFKIMLWIDKGSHHIVQMKVFNKNGFRLLYTIDSFQPNVQLNASDFTFSKDDYPGASVQDLRM